MEVKDLVRQKYAEAARRVSQGEGLPADCCTATGCCSGMAAASCDPITSNLYDERQAGDLPDTALKASLGCGNPTALAQLNPGKIVLDLGSGGGIDVILSAKRVGPKGRVCGLDMTDDMLALARENQRKAGVQNAEFLKGEIENIPLPAGMVDVIVSNCVINLSGDKDRVLAEAFRVLKPGGRFAIADVVVRGQVPESIGFEAIGVEVTRPYSIENARAFLTAAGIDVSAAALQVDGKFVSAFIRARKPAKVCCAGELKCCYSP